MTAHPPSPPSDAAWPDDAVEVGRVIDAWGVKGWIKVQAFSADPQALFSTKRWFLKPPEQPRAPGAAPLPTLLKVTQAREHGEGIVAAVQEAAARGLSFGAPTPAEAELVEEIVARVPAVQKARLVSTGTEAQVQLTWSVTVQLAPPASVTA